MKTGLPKNLEMLTVASLAYYIRDVFGRNASLYLRCAACVTLFYLGLLPSSSLSNLSFFLPFKWAGKAYQKSSLFHGEIIASCSEGEN